MISVLCVNYRSAGEVAELAASLRASVNVSTPIELIVTNNSPDQPLRLESDSRVSVRVFDAPNIGFAAGVNHALRHSTGDRIMIANPDVTVHPDTLAAACDYLDAHSDVGIVLPRLISPDGTVQASIRRFYTWPVVLYARTPLRALGYRPKFFRDYLYESLPRDQPIDVDWGLGAAMFLRRAECDADRIFDERFFLYFEDVDLCLHTWRRGRRVVYCPHLTCLHAHRRASRNPFSGAGWMHLQSMMRFIRKHRGLPQRPTSRATPTAPPSE